MGQRYLSPKVLLNMFVIIFFIVLSHLISAYDLYSELQYLSGSCHPNDTCKNPRNEDEDHLWGNYTCECGEHCLRYGTCCADSPHHGKMLHVVYRGERCQKLVRETAKSVVAVSRCSDRWRYEFQTREKCEVVKNSQEDPFVMTPVTSLITHVTYKNFFCALCNYDTRDLLMWNIDLEMKVKDDVPGLSIITDDYLLENMVYQNEVWGVFFEGVFRKLNLQFKVPLSVRKFVKRCYPTLTTQCDSSYAYNYELQYKCLSYYSPIKLGKISYRNVHCAMCNNVNASSKTDKDICRLDTTSASSKKDKNMFTFALLLDINRSDGDLVGKKQLCDDGSKWDPFFKKCRTLACALPGYVVKNRQCVES